MVHPNDHVNFGQSANDVFPTAMRLATILLFDELFPEMEERLSRAFAACKVTVLRCQKQLWHAQDTLRELGLGGHGCRHGP